MNALANTVPCYFQASTMPVQCDPSVPALGVRNLAAPAMPSGFETELLTEMWSDLTGDRIELTSASDLLALSILGTL